MKAIKKDLKRMILSTFLITTHSASVLTKKNTERKPPLWNNHKGGIISDKINSNRKRFEPLTSYHLWKGESNI